MPRVTALSFTAMLIAPAWFGEVWRDGGEWNGGFGWKRTKSRLRRKITSPDAKKWRITKGSLEARPIFHFTEHRIEVHICICYVAYKLYNELERLLRMLGIHLRVDKALNIAKTISTVTVALPDGTQHTRIMLMPRSSVNSCPYSPLISDLGDPLSKSG